jgi:hypothetical protein
MSEWSVGDIVVVTFWGSTKATNGGIFEIDQCWGVGYEVVLKHLFTGVVLSERVSPDHLRHAMPMELAKWRKEKENE